MRKTRRSSLNAASLDCKQKETSEKSRDNLKVFETLNYFQVLPDSSEEDVNVLVKHSDIFNMKKSDLRKCKTCNFKKRQCLFDPSQCKAAFKQCFICDKPGHFPKSLCCQKRRNIQHKKAKAKRTNICARDQVPITKKNLKLIKMKIHQLEMQKMRGCIVKLAEKCATKFETKKGDSESDKLLTYCSKKLHKLLPFNPMPNSEQSVVIKNILKVYDQMFYNRPDSKDMLLQQGGTHEINPEAKKIGDQSLSIPHLDQLSAATLNNNKDETRGDQNLLISELKDQDMIIPQLDGLEDEVSRDDGEIVRVHDILIPQLDGMEDEVCSEKGEIVSDPYMLIPQQGGLEDEVSSDDGETVRVHDILIYQLDGMEDEVGNGKVVRDQYKLIPQHDGLEDEISSNGEEIIEKGLFSINCEEINIVHMLNFFRSFDLLWKQCRKHELCDPKENCFYCHMRSSSLRLNMGRKKGPKGMKMNEFVSQLNQYEVKLSINWRNLLLNLPEFCQYTLSLLRSSNPEASSYFDPLQVQCHECKTVNEYENIIEIDTHEKVNHKNIPMKNLLSLMVSEKSKENCCTACLKIREFREKIYIFRFSHPINLMISSVEDIGGTAMIYKSHLEERERSQWCAFFRFEDKIFYQNSTGSICQSTYGVHKNSKMLSVYLLPKGIPTTFDNRENLVYPNKVQQHLLRKYLSIMSPVKHELKCQQQREYEINRNKDATRQAYRRKSDQILDQTAERKARDQTEKRRKMHAEVDKERDETDERKKMHAEIDKNRDETDGRKKMHARVDKKRDGTDERKKMHARVNKKREQTAKRKKIHAAYEQTETRLHYVRNRDSLKYQRTLISSLTTDTGMDVICSSCLQYKSKQYCKLVCTLDKEKIKKFIIKKCSLLKNRSNDQFVCNLCFKDIAKDKLPKRSHRNSFKFASFPDYLIKDLRRKCSFKENRSNSNLILDDDNYERQQMQLNKLESHLLKLCIPFIRVAHCPRGRYFKVKGDLILISSDIEHSLNKILPVRQSLIPVCFKRKLSYTGAYIEEYIEKEKVKMYYSWLKRHNHLFKDLELDLNLVEDFELESLPNENEFEINQGEQSNESKIDEEGSSDTDFLARYFDQEPFDPVKSHENEFTHEKTIMFLNKYCEDTDVPSVANRLAGAIVDYEISKQIPIENEDDFLVDDEIISEEQFLEECEETDLNIEESLDEISSTHCDVEDELSDQLDAFNKPTQGQVKIISNIAKKRAQKITRKMETVCVAPGESGSFQNWGKEVFLEEKCFPEKFPFGTGGYLSSCLDNPENEIGFANYCVNQILSCDPKFRNDSSYLFFLLLVKELIQLKRCKTTYFRQATRLPNLSRADVINMDPENLSRFNRSYQVFKSLRGTSMYYEESKKNLMASLRQNGCPSIFLTLSCAEFDWPELLKEILETVYRKKVTQKDIDELSTAEKNRLISENVVQSTLHFQKRIEKMFSLMKYDFFKGSTETYHAASHFYRIEFQQRGAPHVHSLLWLKNKDDEDAPNFWSHSETDQDNSIETKKKKVEDFANSLISTSPDEMYCEKHESKRNSSHVKDCSNCIELKEKVKKYQSHRHTFTCEKKVRSITIKGNEGFGRLDGIKDGPALSNITVCRFKFPKFPLDETKLVLGIPKDADDSILKVRKNDLNKITKYLIRQTYTDQDINELESWKQLQKMDFWKFLYEVGMFSREKMFSDLDDEDKAQAKERYLNAISASVQGTAMVVLKREVKDVFVNGYNPMIMRLHKANHDLQICIDQYSCAQYICGYLTKNESGMSKLLKAVNEETNNLKQVDKLNALASVLDKHREVSIQEAIYRLLGLSMAKSSVVVKYLSTIHPNYRDGLLKGNIEGLDANESIFHNSPHEYYESRPEESDQPGVKYGPEQMEKDYWKNLSLAEFWSDYDIVYGRVDEQRSNLIKLQNGKGYIRKRVKSSAILRYYLNYSNDEDLARGLLILFLPFRNEMEEIHLYM